MDLLHVRILNELATGRADGTRAGTEVELVLAAVLSACVSPLDGELRAAWDATIRGELDLAALRLLAAQRRRVACVMPPPIGAFAAGFAAVAILHAAHALDVARRPELTLSWGPTFRLRHSLHAAYRSANDAASVTPHGDARSVELALLSASGVTKVA